MWKAEVDGRWRVTECGVSSAVPDGLDSLDAQSHLVVADALRLVVRNSGPGPESVVEVLAQDIPLPWDNPLRRAATGLRICGVIIGVAIGNTALVAASAEGLARTLFSKLVAKALHDAIASVFEPAGHVVEVTVRLDLPPARAVVKVKWPSVGPRPDWGVESSPRMPATPVDVAEVAEVSVHKTGPYPEPLSRRITLSPRPCPQPTRRTSSRTRVLRSGRHPKDVGGQDVGGQSPGFTI